MTDQRRTRLLAGAGCIALAAVVAIVGYLKLSVERDVNRQIPYLASAGMAMVLLAAVGVALLVAEQLRTDDRRIEELEGAVRELAAALAPAIEAPARRAPAGVVVVDATDATDATTELPDMGRGATGKKGSR